MTDALGHGDDIYQARASTITRLARITHAITRRERMPLHALALQALRVFRIVKLTKRLTGL